MNFDTWIKLINSNDVADRVEAADEIPETDQLNEVVHALIKRLSDEDILVRTCAADSLRSFSNNKEVLDALEKSFEREKDIITKSYIMSSMAEIADLNNLSDILKRWNDEKNQRIRLHAALGSSLRIVSIATSEILSYMRSADEDLRDASTNALKEIIERMEKIKKKSNSQSD